MLLYFADAMKSVVFVSLSIICLSVCMSVCNAMLLFVADSMHFVCLYLSVCLSVSLCVSVSVCVSDNICLSVCISISHSLCLSFRQSVVPVYFVEAMLFVCLSVSVYLSV